MTERPVFHGLLGAELRELREARGWNPSDVVSFAKRRSLPAISLQQLRYLEEGRTKHPDADVLRTVATLYELSFEELATRFFRANYGVTPVQLPNTLRGEWHLLDVQEVVALKNWRESTETGRESALAVLRVNRQKVGKKNVERRRSR